MNKLNFETKIKPADQFLQDYQVVDQVDLQPRPVIANF